MTERGDGTCSCERCGNYCHQQQSHCDSCQEVRRLREALGEVLEYCRDPADLRFAERAWNDASCVLEETPW